MIPCRVLLYIYILYLKGSMISLGISSLVFLYNLNFSVMKLFLKGADMSTRKLISPWILDLLTGQHSSCEKKCCAIAPICFMCSYLFDTLNLHNKEIICIISELTYINRQNS
jgi:hypothetical protein